MDILCDAVLSQTTHCIYNTVYRTITTEKTKIDMCVVQS